MSKLLYRFRHDVRSVVFLAAGVFILLSLFSFNPFDPSFNSIGSQSKVLNYCGYAGSFLSDLIFQVFGVSAWFIGIGFIKMFWLSVQNNDVNLKTNLTWSVFFCLSVAAIVSLYFPLAKLYQDQIYVGGILGMSLAKVLSKFLNPIGAAVVLWSALCILVVFYFEKPISEIIKMPSFIFDWLKEKKVFSFLASFFKFDPINKREESVKKAFEKKNQDRNFLPIKPEKELEIAARRDEDAENQTADEEIEDEEDLDVALSSAPAMRETKRRVVAKVKTPSKVENWTFPKLSIIDDPPALRHKVDEKEIKRKAELLVDKLAQFSVKGNVMSAKPGPAVTMFEFKPNVDVKLSKITELADDLSLALSSESLRIIAPIPGRDVVGIETSNTNRETVYLKDILAEDEFWSEEMKLPIPLGRQVNGDPKIVDLRKMPHMLVAGTTGSGKSVFTVSFITGLLFKHSPKTLKMILIDPKQVDLAAFSNIPHLIMPPIRDPKKAVGALRWAVREMEKRYKSMSKFGARGLEDYNDKVNEMDKSKKEEHEKINEEFELNNRKVDQYYYTALPYIVIVVEEFGDLMAVDKINVEQTIVRLAQMARACGIHLILAMQSPRKEVVTGLIKTNIPGRISFKVASKMDSRIILDEGGAERLLARGDMLFLSPGMGKPGRNHGPWLSDNEINRVAKFWSDQGEPEYDLSAMRALEGSGGGHDGFASGESGDGEGGDFDGDDSEMDDRYDEILSWASTQKEVSASLIQRKFRLGYPRAARMIETFEREGVVGPSNGSKPRQVLINNYQDRTSSMK